MRMDLERWTKLLSTYTGRDKALRSAYYALLIVIGKLKDAKLAEKLSNLAAQVSRTRLIGRQFNDIPMLLSNIANLKAAFSGRVTVRTLISASHGYYCIDCRLNN